MAISKYIQTKSLWIDFTSQYAMTEVASEYVGINSMITLLKNKIHNEPIST